MPVNGESLQLQVQAPQEQTPIPLDSPHSSPGRYQGNNTQHGSILDAHRGSEAQELFLHDSIDNSLFKLLQRDVFIGSV